MSGSPQRLAGYWSRTPSGHAGPIILEVTTRRTLAGAATALAVLAGGFAAAPVAQAAVDVSLDKVTVAPPKSGKKANVIVVATMAQQEYANISVDVTLQGFKAMRTFPFGDGACPKKLVQVNAPAEVFQCGWTQNGKDATLNMAISGTFPSSRLRIKIRTSAVRTPSASGDYAVTLSSWAFSPLTTSVTIK